MAVDRSVAMTQLRSACFVLLFLLALAHYRLGRLLLFVSFGHNNDPLWKHVKIVKKCANLQGFVASLFVLIKVDIKSLLMTFKVVNYMHTRPPG